MRLQSRVVEWNDVELPFAELERHPGGSVDFFNASSVVLKSN